MKLTPEQRTAALATFSEYFVKNYPGPHTIIGDPNWHAPKIFRAALHAIESESKCDHKGRKYTDAADSPVDGIWPVRCQDCGQIVPTPAETEVKS